MIIHAYIDVSPEFVRAFFRQRRLSKLSMKEYTTEQIRNVALVGHGGSGKTSLVEAMLHTSGATTRLGKVDDGSTVSDYEDEERNRTMSISTALVACEYENHKINLLYNQLLICLMKRLLSIQVKHRHTPF